MNDVLSPTAARRVFLLLTFTRWFPLGLVVGVLTLWILDRGLTISEALLAFSLTDHDSTEGFAEALRTSSLSLAIRSNASATVLIR